MFVCMVLESYLAILRLFLALHPGTTPSSSWDHMGCQDRTQVNSEQGKCPLSLLKNIILTFYQYKTNLRYFILCFICLKNLMHVLYLYSWASYNSSVLETSDQKFISGITKHNQSSHIGPTLLSVIFSLQGHQLHF